jgi:hypothetical protein
LAEAKKAFEARLQALARANHALLRANWGGVDLHQLVRTELETFTQRASINGLSVLLSPQHAQNFTLALHELATNSANMVPYRKVPEWLKYPGLLNQIGQRPSCDSLGRSVAGRL